nr:hypothetical protein [Tanacetum cinerariifolium]
MKRDPIWGCDRLVSRAKVIENQTPTGTIPTTIPDTTPTISLPATHTDTTEIPTIAPTTPLSPNYTPASSNYSPTPDTEFNPSEDPPSNHIPPLPGISLFLSLTDDATNSDTPPSPTHARDSSLDSSLDFHSDASFDSSSRHSLSDHSSFDLLSTFARPSRKRRRSPMTSVPALSPVFGALSHDINPEIQAETDECIAYADALRDRGIDSRVVVEAVDLEESETEERAVECTYETLGSLVQRFHDHTVAIPVHRVHVIKGVQREQGRMIVGVESEITVLTERIAELERIIGDSEAPRVLRVRELTDSSAACHVCRES